MMAPAKQKPDKDAIVFPPITQQSMVNSGFEFPRLDLKSAQKAERCLEVGVLWEPDTSCQQVVMYI